MNIDKEIARKIWTDARSKFDKIPYRVDTDFEVYWMEQQEQVKNCSIPNVVKAKRTCAKSNSDDVIMFTVDVSI